MKKTVTWFLTLLLSTFIVISLLPADCFALEKISSVSVSITAPVKGSRPSFELTLPAGALYYNAEMAGINVRNNITWKDENDANALNPDTGIFAAAKKYMVKIWLTPDKGYEFADSCTATVNGAAAFTESYGDELLVQYVFPATASGTVTLDQVDLDIPGPKVGEYPAYPVSAEACLETGYYNSTYTSVEYKNNIRWWDNTAKAFLMPGADTFTEGHEYQVKIDLDTETGYEFGTGCTALLNGKSASASRSGSTLLVSYTFPALQKTVSEVSVTLSLPQPGEAPSYALSVPEDALYYGEDGNGYTHGVLWMSLSGDNIEEMKYGASYLIMIELMPADGYVFDTEDCGILFNGEAVTPVSLFENYLVFKYTYEVPFDKAPKLSSVSAFNGGHRLEWTPVPGAEGYRIYRKAEGESVYSCIADEYDGASCAYDWNTVSGKKYSYYVRAYRGEEDDAVLSPKSAVRSSVYLDCPKLSTEMSSTGIKLSWKSVKGAAGYYVYRKGPDESSYKKLGSTSNTYYSNTKDLVSGKKYSYKVYAYKTVSGTTYKSCASAVKSRYYLTRPAVSTEISADGIRLSWKAVQGATGYYIYRKGPDDSDYKKIATTSKTSYTNAAKNLVSGKKYSYKVYAYKTVSGSVYKSYPSAVKSLYFLARPSVTLAKSSSSVKVSWPAVKGASGYYVYRKAAGGSYSKIGTTSKLSFTDSGKLKTGVKYSYKVYAYKTVSGTTYKSYPSAVKSITK